jgi:hypothetical protein
MQADTAVQSRWPAEGGREGFVFPADDRCVRDIHHEWVGPAGVYTAMGDEGDHNTGVEIRRPGMRICWYGWVFRELQRRRRVR